MFDDLYVLLYYYFPGHPTMLFAVVVIGPQCSKLIRETVIFFQFITLKKSFITGNGVRCALFISPGNSGIQRHSERAR